MLSAVSDGVTAIIGWFGQVLSALTTAASGSDPAGALYPLLAFIGIAVGLFIVFQAVRLIKSVISTGY